MQVFNFVPPALTPFQFQPTLDGSAYNCTVTWNISGQRWYLNVLTLQNVLVLSVALIGSPDNYDINHLFGYFNSTLVFRQSTQHFEVSP
jgi:hypothetical protein